MAKRKSRSKPARRAAGDAPAQLLETLHRIWLAGLGAAARAQRGAPQLMQELVEEGARIHTETRGAAEKALRGLLGNTKAAVNLRMSQAKGQATDALESLLSSLDPVADFPPTVEPDVELERKRVVH